jgi:drug/metabolite transporter (DMT)-like permease
MTLGIALYTPSDALIKYLMESYPVPQTTFLRAFTRLIPLLLLVFFQGGMRHVFQTAQYKQHFVRLAVNFASTLCFMYAFSFGSLTTIYTFGYTSSFFMTLLSASLLKESVTREKWIAIALGFFGVLIAMQPGKGLFEAAALLVLLATFLAALNKILMRRLAASEHSLAIAIYPNLFMMLAISPYIFSHWEPMPLTHWALFGLVGLLGASGQYAIAHALRFAQGSTLAPTDYSTFLWVLLIDFLFWDKIPEPATLLGACLILSCNFFILKRLQIN